MCLNPIVFSLRRLGHRRSQTFDSDGSDSEEDSQRDRIPQVDGVADGNASYHASYHNFGNPLGYSTHQPAYAGGVQQAHPQPMVVQQPGYMPQQVYFQQVQPTYYQQQQTVVQQPQQMQYRQPTFMRSPVGPPQLQSPQDKGYV